MHKAIPSPLCIEREWGSLRDIVESRQKTEHHFNFYYRPNNGESYCDVYKRSAIFHQWMVNNTVYENNIIVAHGEFNQVYLMHLLNWDVKEFEKWGHQKNGEVWLVDNGTLSSLTPLRPNKYV
jgi:broad specificity phosphatase PhoE